MHSPYLSHTPPCRTDYVVCPWTEKKSKALNVCCRWIPQWIWDESQVTDPKNAWSNLQEWKELVTTAIETHIEAWTETKHQQGALKARICKRRGMCLNHYLKKPVTSFSKQFNGLQNLQNPGNHEEEGIVAELRGCNMQSLSLHTEQTESYEQRYHRNCWARFTRKRGSHLVC